jgi:hypothetical protein
VTHVALLIPFIVTVTFDAGANRRDFTQRGGVVCEMARAMEDVQQIAIDFRLFERSMMEPIANQNLGPV